MDPFIGQVIMFAGNFAPRGWAFCDGQLLQIAQNSALFSILGTTYGGDGRTTFGLPDLRGRTAVHEGSGPGLPVVRLGEKGGRASTTLGVANLPPHNHQATHSLTLKASGETGMEDDPSGHALAASEIYTDQNPTENMRADLVSGTISVQNTGSGTAFDTRSPFLGLNYIIALIGTFPSRN